MDLLMLDFDYSEDTEDVVLWDALAQPQPHHMPGFAQAFRERWGAP
jgi:hypothetical protein